MVSAGGRVDGNSIGAAVRWSRGLFRSGESQDPSLPGAQYGPVGGSIVADQ